MAPSLFVPLCSKLTELTPRRIDPRRRESIEESGMAVVGSGAGMSSFDANRMRCVGTRVAQAAGLAARLLVCRNVQSAPCWIVAAMLL